MFAAVQSGTVFSKEGCERLNIELEIETTLGREEELEAWRSARCFNAEHD
jgi:hypothetical protein